MTCEKVNKLESFYCQVRIREVPCLRLSETKPNKQTKPKKTKENETTNANARGYLRFILCILCVARN